MDNPIVWSIIIGGSIGLLIGLTGIFNISMSRGVALGMLAGFIAAYSKIRRR